MPKLDYDNDDDAVAVGHYVLDYIAESALTGRPGDPDPATITLQEFVSDLIGSTPKSDLDDRYCVMFGVAR